MASKKKPAAPPKVFYGIHDGSGALPGTAYEDAFDAACEAQELAESEGAPWYVAKMEVVEAFEFTAPAPKKVRKR